MNLSDEIWNLVVNRDSFKKFNIGTQFVKTAYSISSDISEGFGRYFYRENKQT
jgi:four helix bundle protein